MLHHSQRFNAPLLPELEAELLRVRRLRGFCAADYISAKTRKIASYFTTHHLRSAVVGISGGIDSAVVLGLLLTVQRNYPEVMRKVVPLLLPMKSSPYVTGQEEGLLRATAQCAAWNVDPVICDLSAVHLAYERQIHASVAEPEKNVFWAKGQLASNVRTPALYYTASCLTADGLAAVVVGTVNRDEGAYLGYMGKASDCMVDLQVIADLHKSEVNRTAEMLDVIPQILRAVPTGDMFDGRVDTDVFGAPYDFVELYLAHRCMGCTMSVDWSDAAREQYIELSAALESLHRFNAHKYSVGSPAVHLNVQPSAVPGGWRE